MRTPDDVELILKLHLTSIHFPNTLVWAVVNRVAGVNSYFYK